MKMGWFVPISLSHYEVWAFCTQRLFNLVISGPGAGPVVGTGKCCPHPPSVLPSQWCWQQVAHSPQLTDPSLQDHRSCREPLAQGHAPHSAAHTHCLMDGGGNEETTLRYQSSQGSASLSFTSITAQCLPSKPASWDTNMQPQLIHRGQAEENYFQVKKEPLIKV